MTAIHVLPITQRKHIPQQAIDDVVRQIAEKFQPHKIIFFRSCEFGMDLLVKTPQVPAERINLGDSFLREIVCEGKVVYPSTHR